MDDDRPVNTNDAGGILPHKALVDKTQSLWKEVRRLETEWASGPLRAASPDSPDLDGYVKPLITIAELLRLQGMRDLSRHVYERAIDVVNEHCRTHAVDLHRGALYANYAIAQFEIGRYTQALSWLHAAVDEDKRHRQDIKTIYDSFAFSDEGIFGQWLKARFIPALPADVAHFVTGTIGLTITNTDIRTAVRWLAGRGDLSLFSGVVEYSAVGLMNDYHAQTVRLTCIRDLATLCEVLLKMLGQAHKDATVASSFATQRTLAAIICHMHFARPLKKRRKNPVLSTHHAPGLFRNSLAEWPGLVSSIDSAIDFCGSNPPDQVLAYLKGTVLCASDATTDAMAKRLLMSYRLRNETSHNLNPTDPAMVGHYDEYRLWLLQAIFSSYFWASKSGAVNL